MDKAFVTGSQAYGMPRPVTRWEKNPSDLDLVVMVSRSDLKTILDFYEATGVGPPGSWEPGRTGEPAQASLRFGMLNLIVCTREEDYEMWQTGTAALKDKKPVTRDFAVAMFDKIKQKMKAWQLFPEESLS
jgi:hypothetical protein